MLAAACVAAPSASTSPACTFWCFSTIGFWFMLVDPWPGTWAENWYADDDVYIDYDDGYYLCNRSYPGIRLAITVSL